ncbi:myelin basic protein-like isoform X2 [Danio aesculapii]|uniref:myelin basic protein-like isoform X2 n=1 Tax=Danio aesculapii TaxID=1142201 RepID=UPI0024BF7685|nr:myelin basic protein-like isoform X2 [Danio aesculapii]
MATASTSGQNPFGLGRKKKAPGVLDQISRFFGGDKKRKGKGSFRGHLSSSPQRPHHSSTRRRGDVNPVVHFFRSFVSSPRPKSRASPSARGSESIRSPQRRRREQNTLSRIFNLTISPEQRRHNQISLVLLLHYAVQLER